MSLILFTIIVGILVFTGSLSIAVLMLLMYWAWILLDIMSNLGM